MTARILVVDDEPVNRRLLEARLSAEYYEVTTASSGEEALAICEAGGCDIVLLDVMMPGLDGYETCRRLKASPKTAHLPVVLVTALDQAKDRVRGLTTGADDFLTKPIDEAHLFARMRSLARLKLVIDEVRGRAATSTALGLAEVADFASLDNARGKVLLIEDLPSSAERLRAALEADFEVVEEPSPQEALLAVVREPFDVAILSLSLKGFDALRLCSQIRALERTRQLPILVIAEPDDRARVLRGLDIGVNDWLSRPVDRNELLARARTQFRQKRYVEMLREQVEQSLELAVMDSLTGLNNRRFFEKQLTSLIKPDDRRKSLLTLIVLDIDHFKRINDTYGHDAGDEVLKGFAQRLRAVVRGGEYLCRVGGEEFAMLLPGVTQAVGERIAERIRKAIADKPFPILQDGKEISVTTSVGVAERRDEHRGQDLYRSADSALYRAKSEGRNRVMVAA